MGSHDPEQVTTGGAEALAAARVLCAAGGALWQQARLHGELASLEWAAERRRLARCGVLAASVVVLAACATAAVGAMVLSLAWDTPARLAAAIALPFAYAGAAVLVGARLRKAWLGAGSPFAATRAELLADLAVLRGRG